MPGVNLSQSMNEEEQSEERSFFDTGIILSLVGLLVMGVAWGGLLLYISSIDKKIATIDASLSSSATRLKGDRIDRVADFDTRLNYFSSNKAEFTSAQEVFQKLERSVVDGVVVTKFKYDHENREAIFEGNCADFKKLAEQIMALKADASFLQVAVERTSRNEANQVEFALKASF